MGEMFFQQGCEEGGLVTKANLGGTLQPPQSWEPAGGGGIAGGITGRLKVYREQGIEQGSEQYLGLEN